MKKPLDISGAIPVPTETLIPAGDSTAADAGTADPEFSAVEVPGESLGLVLRSDVDRVDAAVRALYSHLGLAYPEG